MDSTNPPSGSPKQPGEPPKEPVGSKKKKKTKTARHDGRALAVGLDVSVGATPKTMPSQVSARMEARSQLRNKMVVSVDQSKKMFEGIMRQGLDMLRIASDAEVAPAPEVYYVLARAGIGLQKARVAQANADKLLESISDRHPLYVSAVLLKAQAEYYTQMHFTDQVAEGFKKAYELGHPDAVKYMMAARSGMSGELSIVKWCSPLDSIKIVRSFPELSRRFEDSLVRRRLDCSDLPNDHPKVIACSVMESTEGFNPDDMLPMPLINFGRAMCDLTMPDRRSNAEQRLEFLYPHFGSPTETVRLMHQYLLYQLTGDREYLDKVVEGRQPSAMLFAAKSLEKLDPDYYESWIMTFYQSDSCLLMVQGYEHLAEYHLKKGRGQEAIAVFSKGIERIQAFLDGATRLYGKLIGEQADLRAQNPLWSKDQVEELRFEELEAAHQHLRRFIAKRDFLEDEWLKPEVLEKVVKEPPVNKAAEVQKSDPQARVESVEHLKLSEKPLSDEVKSKPKVEPVSCGHIRREMNRANELMRNQAEFDQAEQILRKLEPEKLSGLWFQKEQSLCWVTLEKATNYDYLSGKLKKEESMAGKGHKWLVEADSRTRKLIREIEKLGIDNPDELNKLRGDSRFCQNEEAALSVVQGLKEKGLGHLARQYGSLYSTLGHICKAFKDNPVTRSAKYNKEGMLFYFIANRIRGRRVVQ